MLKQTSEIAAIEGRLTALYEGGSASREDIAYMIRRLRKAREEIADEYFKRTTGASDD